MKKRDFGMYIMAIMLAAASLTMPVTAEAYLTPSNSAVLDANATSLGREQIKYKAASYLDDYNATQTNTYIIGPGSIPDYLTTPNWANSPPLRKFVDTLPGLGAANANNLGQYIPVAVPDIVTYPGSDYYVIELREYTEQAHSDLPSGANATFRRGYIQTNLGTDTSGGCTDPALNSAGACTQADNTKSAQTIPHDLGPVIVAQKDRAVRVKFVNKLPTGAGGDLFIPVDTSVMGAGPFDVNYDPVTKLPLGANATSLDVTKVGDFTQNRGLLHLHGGRTPWISDGTPHQWITPAGEVTDYPTGVSVQNVPDMPDPGPGANTYYWTNQQSSRMMFYHDHAWGITRLNVYVGEAAGYIIRDDTETALIDGGIIPGTKTDGTVSMGGEIPLVFEDKTFVDPDTITLTDPTWEWGSNPWTGVAGDPMTPVKGDLWWPHVYMPAENPDDITGIAPMGRWAYGPYFWPPTNNLFQPVPNPYYVPTVSCNDPFLAPGQLCCDGDPSLPNPDLCCDPNDDTTPGSLGGFCQAPTIPGSPNPSLGAEAFMDTTLVNGTAYPVLQVDAKAYRLRILNAAHDRFYNLQMYIADNSTTAVGCAGFTANGYNNFAGKCASETEVRMVSAGSSATSSAPPGGSVLSKPANWPEDGREGGVPDWSWVGPSWVMIGSEGGFLPQPVVIPNQPTLWNVDVTTFNAGNVNGGSLILGPAERADVIVDFSQYAGKTLILYNDAPAPWPALDPHYDYYTNDPDRQEMGGAPSTPVGFGPNVRTIMQIKVSSTADAAFDLTALKGEFDPATSTTSTVGAFRDSQDDIVVAQGNMNPNGDPLLYEAFVHNRPDGTGYQYDAYNKIYQQTFPSTFSYAGVSQIFDKQIEFFDPQGGWHQVTMKKKAIQDEQGETFDEFGRMRANLGLTAETPGAGVVNFVVQSFADPSTEILAQNDLQIWKITHNGVDTHPIHFHLYDVQVLNRVGWDGFVRLPDPTEQGWKDTVRISPLEDTIVAVRPVTPMLPFGVPESYRPLNPATPLGDATNLSLVDPTTGNAWLTANVNDLFNFDWEYVWHCHILSHEENDMMRPVIFQFQESVPDAPILDSVTKGGVLTWTDPTSSANPFALGSSRNEIGFHVERCDGGCVSTDTFTVVGDALANATAYTDTSASGVTTYSYRVVAFNAAGDSMPSNITTITTGTLAAPTVAITSPSGGTSYNFGDAISITATSSTNVGQTITKVEFYVNGVLFSTDSNAPYTYNWTNAIPGSYSLTAMAYDNIGVTTTSVPVPITVLATSTPVLGAMSPQGLVSSANIAQTFTAVYSDVNGVANLDTTKLLIRSTLGAANAIIVQYARSSGTLSLYNDAGNVSISCTIGQAVILTNTQGSVDCAASTMTEVGADLTLNLSITPTVSFASATPKNIYMWAMDNDGLSAGWLNKGSWTVQVTNVAPTIGTVSPTPSTSIAGTPHLISAVYSDAHGFGDINTAKLLVRSTLGATNAIIVQYDRRSHDLLLYNDAGNVATSCTIGQVATLTNSQGSVDCAASTATEVGTNLTLKVSITPDPSFASVTAKKMYMWVNDNDGLVAGWANKGSWTVQASNTAPVLGTLTPSTLSSTPGTPQTITGIYSDVDGVSNINNAKLLIRSTLGAANAIIVQYSHASGTLSLFNDAGNATTSCTLGQVATLTNSQGVVDCAASTVTAVGNDLTLTINITPDAAFASATAKKMFMWVQDDFGLSAGWTEKGAWTIQ